MIYPKQGSFWGRSLVCFDYDTSQAVLGLIVRDDAPGILIIRLVDGRHVLSTECQLL